MIKQLLIGTCCAVFFTGTAQAAEKLTKQSIEAFIEQTTKLTHADSGLSDEEAQDFLNQHLDDSGIYKSVITYDIPGFPPTPQELSLTKQDFIDNVITGRDSMEKYDSSVKVTKTEITKDGQYAIIMTKTSEKGITPVSPEEKLPFDGVSLCKQHLKIGEEDRIILVSAECETQMSFEPF